MQNLERQTKSIMVFSEVAYCNVSSILIGGLRERYFDSQFLQSTQRIIFTSFFSHAGFTMSRGD